MKFAIVLFSINNWKQWNVKVDVINCTNRVKELDANIVFIPTYWSMKITTEPCGFQGLSTGTAGAIKYTVCFSEAG